MWMNVANLLKQYGCEYPVIHQRDVIRIVGEKTLHKNRVFGYPGSDKGRNLYVLRASKGNVGKGYYPKHTEATTKLVEAQS